MYMWLAYQLHKSSHTRTPHAEIWRFSLQRVQKPEGMPRICPLPAVPWPVISGETGTFGAIFNLPKV